VVLMPRDKLIIASTLQATLTVSAFLESQEVFFCASLPAYNNRDYRQSLDFVISPLP
jgi:hypothetical protein